MLPVDKSPRLRRLTTENLPKFVNHSYTVQLTSTKLVVWKSVDDTHVIACSLRHRWAYDATRGVQTMHSGIKRGTCWKCSSDLHAICVRYSFNNRPCNISTDTERRADLPAIAELLVLLQLRAVQNIKPGIRQSTLNLL